MATAGYTLQCYGAYSYDVGGWYNYGFQCKGSAANTSYVSNHAYVRFAYWNGSHFILDTGPITTTLEGMSYNGYSGVTGYNQGQSVHMGAFFFSTLDAAQNFGSTGSAGLHDNPQAEAWITLPTVTVNYTVTYDSNGATSGSPNPTSQTVSSGAVTVLGTVGTAVKTNYIADGWAESASGDKKYDFEQTYTVTGNKIFYIHWVRNVYNMTVTNDGNGTATVSSATITAGDSVTFTATPNTNYIFSGWYSNNVLISTVNPYSFVPTNDVSLEAKFNDTRSRISYLWEKVTNKSYPLKDNSALKIGSVATTTYEVPYWTGSSTMASKSWTPIDGAVPSDTHSVGDVIVAYREADTSGSFSSYVAGTRLDLSSDYGGRGFWATLRYKVTDKPNDPSISIVTLGAQIHSRYYDGWGSMYLEINGVTVASGNGYGADGGSTDSLISINGANYWETTIEVPKTAAAQTKSYSARMGITGTGSSGYATQSSVTIPALGDLYAVYVATTSSTYSKCKVKRYNGSSWDECYLGIYNGSNWIKGRSS